MNKAEVLHKARENKIKPVNVFDKVRIYLQEGSFIRPMAITPAQNSHIKCGYRHGETYIEVTGKLLATPTNLGGITYDNFTEIIEPIRQETGVIITAEELLNSRVTSVDVKHDMILPEPMSIGSFISILRERGYQATGNTEMFSFEKQQGFDWSILNKTTTKTTHDSLAVYYKYREMVAKRKNDGGYFDSFDDEFIEDIVKRTVRFERRVSQARDLRKAFHLDDEETVTLYKVLACQHDVVSERVNKLFRLSIGEQRNEK